MATIKIVVVAGARPNFVKVAPLMKAFEAGGRIAPLLVHTGQHYDQKMSQVFFEHLGIAPPAVNLGVGSGSHAAQTAAVMTAFEPVLLEHRPVAVLVVGDVNSTIACGLVAAKLGVTLVHVEAGLRSFDRTMPEEINRLLTDAISDVLFCTERSGVENLRREGVAEEKIFLVGNVMVDSLLAGLSRAGQSTILRELGLERGRYAVLTLHRPSNVDDGATLAGILAALGHVQHELPIVFPVHPRTRASLGRPEMTRHLAAMPNLRMIDPAGYLDFLRLMSCSRVVLTDSGGIQEETTILKVPCLTLRANTERPVTVELGTNRLVGTDGQAIWAAFREAMDGKSRPAHPPPLWDGLRSPANRESSWRRDWSRRGRERNCRNFLCCRRCCSNR